MFVRTAIFYQGIPANYVLALKAPLADMQSASAAGDSERYFAGYTKLTQACNMCHQAAHVGFIVIKTPSGSPFTDEKF